MLTTEKFTAAINEPTFQQTYLRWTALAVSCVISVHPFLWNVSLNIYLHDNLHVTDAAYQSVLLSTTERRTVCHISKSNDLTSCCRCPYSSAAAASFHANSASDAPPVWPTMTPTHSSLPSISRYVHLASHRYHSVIHRMWYQCHLLCRHTHDLWSLVIPIASRLSSNPSSINMERLPVRTCTLLLRVCFKMFGCVNMSTTSTGTHACITCFSELSYR